ncbi:MAG: peptide chain release factor 1 [Candidatus Omnitrophica bacterium]|nr:peptide chain release factor 1 [Candidatus Omnitrophota bacterium]
MQISRQQLLERLAQLEKRYIELENHVAEAAATKAEPQAYQQLAKELSQLRELVSLYRTYQSVEQDAEEAESISESHADPDLQQMAREEAVSLRRQQTHLVTQMERLWKGQHEEPERPFIIEIRAGTGGQEASLFTADLARMYTKYAARYNLTVEPMYGQRTEAGGFKEVAISIRGPGAWQRFQFESGVHRVQRVPETEAQGRIHTSTVTVAVLPEPEDVELPAIPQKDLQIDVYRSSGPGGQGVNTTDSAVRIRHIPTGLIVTCQDERSQLRNKEKAMRVLRARLLDRMQAQQAQQIASNRRQQVGTGERSEKIRTYNFPDRRVTDHRVGLTLHKLDLVLEGELDEITQALLAQEHSK